MVLMAIPMGMMQAPTTTNLNWATTPPTRTLRKYNMTTFKIIIRFLTLKKKEAIWLLPFRFVNCWSEISRTIPVRFRRRIRRNQRGSFRPLRFANCWSEIFWTIQRRGIRRSIHSTTAPEDDTRWIRTKTSTTQRRKFHLWPKRGQLIIESRLERTRRNSPTKNVSIRVGLSETEILLSAAGHGIRSSRFHHLKQRWFR